VVLVERYPTLGGVCLNVGCIPSKALLHAAKVIAEAREMGAHGLTFAKPEIDLDKLADWKDGVVGRLTGGLAGLAKQRKVQVVQGVGKFTSANQLEVATANGRTTIGFEQAIIAAGSAPIFLPFIPKDDPRVMDSTGALELDDVPKRLLVLGGGIIGLEMATVYHELGAKITVVELMDQLIPGADPDIVRPLHKRIEELYENIFLATKVTDIKPGKKGLEVTFSGGKAPERDTFDKVLVAVGRRPNGQASRSTSGASSRSTASSAPTSTTSSRSATSSASRCWPTRRPTRPRSRPRPRPAATASSTSSASRRSPIPTRRSPGPA
jgi:dihydrolipoamide dehydrogenase